MTKSSAPSNKELAEKLKKAFFWMYDGVSHDTDYPSDIKDSNTITSVIKSLESSASSTELEELRKRVEESREITASSLRESPRFHWTGYSDGRLAALQWVLEQIDEVRKRE